MTTVFRNSGNDFGTGCSKYLKAACLDTSGNNIQRCYFRTFNTFNIFAIFSNNFNKYFVPFSCFPNFGKMRAKIGQKMN